MFDIAAGVFAGIVGAVWFLGWLARRAKRRAAAHLTAAVKESFRQYYLTLPPAPPPPPAALPPPAEPLPSQPFGWSEAAYWWRPFWPYAIAIGGVAALAVFVR